MFVELMAFAKSNPILLGGVGTVLFSALMYIVKGVPKGLVATIKRLTTVEMMLTSESALYHDILSVLSNHRIGVFSRNYTTSRGGQLVCGYGRSIGTYGGRLFVFERKLIENNLRLDESLTILWFSRDRALLQKLLSEAVQPNDHDKIKVVASQSGGYWDEPIKKKRRSLDTVFVSSSIKHTIITKIDWFLKNEAWYVERGIPYKLIFLLSGEPGTGKTSLIFAVASHFGRALGAASHLDKLDRLFRNGPENMFLVIEDIDMLTVSREGDDKAASNEPRSGQSSVQHVDMDGKALNALQVLFNTLDGLGTPHGLILFITTNYKTRLDPALVRDGRIDCDLEIGRLGPVEVEDMFVAFYGENARQFIRPYVASPRFKPHTGAELQVLFMSKTPLEALALLRDKSERLHVVAAE